MKWRHTIKMNVKHCQKSTEQSTSGYNNSAWAELLFEISSRIALE